ncbi:MULTISPECIES: VOC family protein [Mycolicibacterium]|jgi:isopenicillin-N N-acyltransferase-like protein|uniref:Catechol 2,3-dioxygenase-like lactoylglutathione lyase family enzyme n=1 Tax=Mycolicibacterium frederiksbergense TaxID=117567 RepID=A0ABT6KZ05_9MYCO|nr:MULTISPECIES: VOC family protein [Mycolicibacterium]MDH6195924.1 catechol 2,3-dioxygenase-like lactoylglutathione lyase family enzyme [Mycolicibacterium frederiksbergense]
MSDTTPTTLFRNGIDNSDILTKDVDRLVEFYHGVLGLPFFLPYEKDQGWASIDFGNIVFYIFESKVGEHAPNRTHVNADNPPGLDSFAFHVKDLDEAVAYLDGKVEWAHHENIPWEHPSGVWYRFRPFYDPDGNLLYATEPHTEGSLR